MRRIEMKTGSKAATITAQRLGKKKGLEKEALLDSLISRGKR